MYVGNLIYIHSLKESKLPHLVYQFIDIASYSRFSLYARVKVCTKTGYVIKAITLKDRKSVV